MKNRTLLISGGNILTGDPLKPVAQSMLIRDNRIVSTGTYEQLNSCPEAVDCLRLDLEGNSVLPGLTDAHLHLASAAKQNESLSLRKAASLAEMLDMIREHATSMVKDEWIYGVGFNDSLWPEKRLPTRQDLDTLQLSNPIVLVRTCAHIHVANSIALQAGGLSTDLDVLYEDQASPITGKMLDEKFNPEKMIKALHKTCLTLASQGITCAHTCGCSAYGLGEDMEIYRELKQKSDLPLRVIYYSDEIPGEGVRSGDGDGWLRYGGYKMYLDGSLGGRTAALTQPYHDQRENRGILNHDVEEVKNTILAMHSRNVQTQVHAIGDAAVDQFLEALSYTYANAPRQSSLRHRIVHLQICRSEQITALKELGAICDIQPSFVPSDITIAEERLGNDRRPWAYRWRDMVKAGLLVTGSSDAPVESTDPFRGVWAAVNRTSDDRFPEGGWRPDQKLSLGEALQLFTTNPWKATGLSNRFGLLKTGYPADLVILDRNIEKEDPALIKDVRPLLTMVEGITSFGKLEGWPSFL